MSLLAECLEEEDLPGGAPPSDAQARRLDSYLLNHHRGAAAVRDIILADIRGFLDLGLPHVAAELVVVLRLLLARCPEARRDLRRAFAWDDADPVAGR